MDLARGKLIVEAGGERRHNEFSEGESLEGMYR